MILSKATEGQQFLECGCGTGRLSLMASKGWGLHATGVELIQSFTIAGNRIKRWLHIEDCQILFGDMFEVDWREADIVYVTSTTFPLLLRRRLTHKWKELESGTQIFTLTYPPEGEHIKVLSSHVLDFSWGAGTLFHAEVI